MSELFTPCIPHSIDRAKRVAKRLNKIFDQKTLAQCQAATAKLFGHKDWHALEQAIASDQAPGPNDEDLSDAEHEKRIKAQFRIACTDLGEIDLDSDTTRPRVESPKGPMTDEMLAEHLLAEENILEKRLRAAMCRFRIYYALDAVSSIRPTSKSPNFKDHYIKGASISCDEDDFKHIPARIGLWWHRNIPHQPEVASAIRGFKLDPEDRFSIMQFGGYWGELCHYYSRTINFTMVMGVAYLLSTQYGAIYAINSPKLPSLMGQEDEERIAAGFQKLAHEGALSFLEAYPRDDLAPVFRSQAEPFEKAAADVMDILSDPGSTRGTWEDEERRARNHQRTR
jgi:hypothetical protein